MATTTTQRPLLLLSLDGGGIRGLSSILILKEILRKVNRGVPTDQHLQPWQAFDLIGGTSTGGIIAVMLGRLRMSLKECEDAYLELGREIFAPKRANWDGRRLIDFVQANEKFDSAVLERSIKAIIQEKTGDENSPLKSAQTTAEDDCKVFVCSVLERNSEPVFLRSYEPSQLADPLSDDFALWQALRATSAASTFFDAYQHGKKKFVDGGFAYNNPVQRVMIEASDLWGSDRPAILVSIGTGESMGSSLGGNIKDLAQSMVKLVTQTERTAEDFYSSHRALVDGEMYFRFNVPGLATIGMQEYNEVEAIDAQTIAYLTKGKTGAELRAVTQKVRNLQSTENFDTTLVKVGDLPAEDQSCLQGLFARAGDYDNHRTQLDLPVHGTCSWIFQHPKFANFRDSKEPCMLWITGNPGCGKSILARFLADQLKSIAKDEETAKSAPIACFFFFRDGQDKRTHSTSALSALLHQLFLARPLLTKVGREEYAAKGNGINLSSDTLWRILCQACSKIPHREVICIVDALDECSEESRNRLIRLMQSTFASTPNTTVGRLKVLVTSRPWPEIEQQFGANSSIRLRGENETRAVAHDIDLVIRHQVKGLKRKGILTPEICDMVEQMLSQNADGTFLWSSLVLESIVSLPSRKLTAVQQKLVGIPRELSMLYDHALPESHDEAETKMSRKLLSILLASTRPLSLDELNICLSLESTIETLRDMETEPDINHTVKSLGGFFVRVTHSEVSLVHQTAREYLLRDDSVPSGKSWKHSIGILESNLTLARSCIQFLALKDWEYFIFIEEFMIGCEPRDYGSALCRALPQAQGKFYHYAATTWFQHVKTSDPTFELPPDFRKLIHDICDLSKKTFAIWWSCFTATNGLKDVGEHYLHCAAKQGEVTLLQEILKTNSLSIIARDQDGYDVLSVAARANQDEVISWILSEFSCEPLDTGNALVLAIRNRNETLARRIINNSQVDVNGRYDDLTPLSVAVTTGDMKIVQFLVAQGASLFDKAAFQRAATSLKWRSLTFMLDRMRSGDPAIKCGLFQEGIKTVISKKFERGEEALKLILNAGLALPGRHRLPFRLIEAVIIGAPSDVMNLIAEDARDEGGIALILGCRDAEVLEVLINTQNYETDQIWTALYYLDGLAADFFRRLCPVRFTPLNFDHPRFSWMRRRKLPKDMEDECLWLLLRRLTGTTHRFSPTEITRLWPPDIVEYEYRRAIAKLEVGMIQSALTLASICGADGMIPYLARNADVNALDKHGMTPLLAAVLGRSERAISTLRDTDVSASVGAICWYTQGDNGRMTEGTDTKIRLFCSNAVDQAWEFIWTILGKDTFVESPLSFACQSLNDLHEKSARDFRDLRQQWLIKQSAEVIQYNLDFIEYKSLFAKSKDPYHKLIRDLKDMKEAFGNLEQSAYAFLGHVPEHLVAQELGFNGRTALHLAIENGLDTLVLELLRHGQSAAALDYEGNTPLHFYAVSDAALDVTTIDAMIYRGANIAAVNNGGRTALHLSIEMAHFDRTQILVQLGSPVNTQTNEGLTSLHEATRSAAPISLVELLLQHGATPLSKDASGSTPLHCAILRVATDGNGTEIIELLVRRMIPMCGSLDTRYGDGLTLVEFAEKTRQTELRDGCKEAMDNVIRFLRAASDWVHSGLEQGEICEFYEEAITSASTSVPFSPAEGFWNEELECLSDFEE